MVVRFPPPPTRSTTAKKRYKHLLRTLVLPVEAFSHIPTILSYSTRFIPYFEASPAFPAPSTILYSCGGREQGLRLSRARASPLLVAWRGTHLSPHPTLPHPIPKIQALNFGITYAYYCSIRRVKASKNLGIMSYPKRHNLLLEAQYHTWNHNHLLLSAAKNHTPKSASSFLNSKQQLILEASSHAGSSSLSYSNHHTLLPESPQ